MGKLRFFLVFFLVVLLMSGSSAQNSFDDLFHKSRLQFVRGNYSEALNINIKALELIEGGTDCFLHAKGNIQVGNSYYFLHDKRTALSYYFKTLQFCDSCHLDSVKHVALHNIGAVYTELGKVDSALLYLEQSKKILEKTSDYDDLAKVNAVIADLHLNNTHNYELAKIYIDSAEKYAEKSGNTDWQGFVQIKYSLYYRFTRKYPLAVAHARKALFLYEMSGAVEGRMYALNVLAYNLTLVGDTEAGVYYQKLLTLRDSIFKVETANKMADYRISYETEKKAKENDLLQQKNKVSQLQIDSKNKTIIALSICMLFSVIIVFWRVSVINLRKKEQELLTQQKLQLERERISRDLHDTVGGQLSYILFSLEADEEVLHEKRKEKSASLAGSIRSVTRNLRETIWALNQGKLTLKNLSDKLKLYTRNMFAYTDVKVKFEEHIENDCELNPAFTLNLFRICQEIINNAFKHSKVSELIVKIEREEKIKISIIDNGIGFDKNNTEVNEHYGLSNLFSRAKEINAELEIESELNKGSRITVII